MKRFISTHSLVLALPMRLDHLPDRGASVEASTAAARPGGGFVVLAAAAAQGITAATASPLGTGPNSFTVRQHLEDAHIQILSSELVGDIGIAIQFIEANGSMTSVVTTGVEREPTLSSLNRIAVREGDIVHISGIDLTSPSAALALAEWGASLPTEVTLVVSLSPAVEDVPISAWRQLLSRANIVTMNIRERMALEKLLGATDNGISIRDLMHPQAAIVHRMGAQGCEIISGATSEPLHLAPYAATTVDTEGVGDTHIATMCARLLQGRSLVEACRAANAAAAIVIAHESAFPVPTYAEIEEVLTNNPQ